MNLKLGLKLCEPQPLLAVHDAAEFACGEALLVHAIHDRAKQFYEYYGFQAAPLHPLTLMLRLSSVKS